MLLLNTFFNTLVLFYRIIYISTLFTKAEKFRLSELSSALNLIIITPKAVLEALPYTLWLWFRRAKPVELLKATH